MTVKGEVNVREDGELAGLREEIATGTIEGKEYKITKNIGSGMISVEFKEDKTDVHYDLGSLLEDAYQEVYGDDNDE